MLKNPKVLLILATAMNLRLAITAVTPLFTAIQRSLYVTSSLTALLITLPLLCFSLGAIATPHLIQRFGPTTLLWTTNALLLLASLLRPVTTGLLLATTIVIGLAVAVLNVLVPTLIAQTTITGATRLTSAYAITMNVVAALGTAIAIPLAIHFSWQLVLQSFGSPALITLGLLWWAPRRLFTQPTTAPAPSVSLRSTLQHDKQARWLTVFMGLQSLIFYSLTTWLPTIFHDLGATTATAGNLLAVFQLVGIPAALVLTRVTNLRHLLWGLLVGYAVGGLALLWPGLGWWLAAGLLGFISSLIFTLALTLIATSSSHVNVIANRSAVAQSLGYLLAAIGPVLLGQIHDFTDSWGPVLGVLGGLVLLTIGIGLHLSRMPH